jgi:hypothetical protein
MLHRSLLLLGLFASVSHGFVTPLPKTKAASRSTSSLYLREPKHTTDASPVSVPSRFAVAAAAFATACAPLLALAAAEEEDYEYGAVNAPGGIGIAVVGGILAILTALLPVLLRGGEEAFEEIRERDQDTFGKKADVLKKRKK